MADIGLCLIGAGRWGRRYIETIGALEGMRLTALASRNPSCAELVPSGCRIFANWRDAVRAPGVDAVIVATPPHLHVEMTLDSIAAGRSVLVEKPLTLSFADASAIEERADQCGVLVVVGHTHLYNPAFRELTRRLHAIGDVQTIRSVAGNWGPFRPDVTPLWDWAPHDLSMCLNLLGRRPENVAADCLALEWRDGGWAGDYQLCLRFSGGISAAIHVGNMMQPKSRRFEVEGKSGTLIFDDVSSTLILRRGSTDTAIPFPSEKPLTVQIREFADAVRNGRTSDPSLRLGRDIVEIIARCEREAASRRP